MLRKASKLLLEGNLDEASKIYKKLEGVNPCLDKIVSFNNTLIQKRRKLIGFDCAAKEKTEFSGQREIKGSIDRCNHGELRGWAAIVDCEGRYEDNSQYNFELWIDSSFVANIKPCLYRKDLESKGVGLGGRCSFSYRIDHKHCDGKLHRVEVKVNRVKGLLRKNIVIEKAEEDRLYLKGGVSASAVRMNILLVAHQANDRIYGGERSFMDVVEALDRDKYNLFVCIPRAAKVYVDNLKSKVTGIYVGGYTWRDISNVNQSANLFFQGIFKDRKFDLAYLNTIMLREAALAARAAGVTVVTHVREIINQDPDLCNRIGGSPAEIIEQVIEESDFLIPNSRVCENLFSSNKTLPFLYNAVDFDRFSSMPVKVSSGPLKVAMISSNLPKKGIYEFYKLFLLAVKAGLDIQFTLYGPENKHTDELKHKLEKYGGDKRFAVAGYIEDPVTIFDKIDILFSLSTFAESFGRTIAEAMASGKVVISYDYGAPSELIRNGETGYLIPYKRYSSSLPILKTLNEKRALLEKLGECAKMSARAFCKTSVFPVALNDRIDAIFSDHARYLANKDQPLVSVVIPNYNYEKYMPERILSIANQTYKNIEVIFLDDQSTDESVFVARRMLVELGLQHRVIVNDRNLGTYGQWLKGIALAEGEYVWIAEADDVCKPDLLSKLVARMKNPRCNIAYCQSYRLDGDSEVTAEVNTRHTDGVCPDRWLKDYDNLGLREVVDFLSLRNTIPNASAALLRKSATAGAEEALREFRYSGDRFLYAYMLKDGDISFVSEPLNGFRRHGTSVTTKRGRSPEILMENARIRSFIAENFPLISRDTVKMDSYLNSDYKVEGVAVNSQHPSIRKDIEAVSEKVKDRKRFAFITCNNGSFDGGSEVWWREIIPHLRAQGHDVLFLIKCWHPKPEFISDLERLGVKPLYKHLGGFSELLRLEPDLTAISVGDQDEGTEYYDELISNDLKYVIVNRLTKEERFWPIRASKQEAVKRGYLNAQKVFFTCRNNHKVMEDRLGAEIPEWGRIYSPCHADRSKPVPYPSTQNGFSLAVPAKIQFVHKGQDLLIEVFAQEKWRERNVVVNFYGVGKDIEKLKELIEEKDLAHKMFLRGKIVQVGEEHSISDIWKENHAVLMGSRMEGFPNMVLNAMISGRVPIVPDIGGCAEIIEDGENGFIAKNPSATDIGDALERAWARRGEWEDLGLRSREAALDYLPEDVHHDTLVKITKIANT